MLFGIDTSHYESNVNWNVVKNQCQFAFTKASEGLAQKDLLFDKYWAEMKAAGLIRGCYHFFHPNLDPEMQARFFLSIIGALRPGDLPPVLDFETEIKGFKTSDYIDSALSWLHTVEDAIQITPIIYGSPGVLSDLGGNSLFKKYPLWVAEYGVQAPKIPKPWTDYSFWQFSEEGTCEGVPQKCDVNYFNGALNELKALSRLAQ